MLALGPLSVRPDRQRQGVGSALMHAVLGAADALGERLVALLGSTAYYPRFGFRPARPLPASLRRIRGGIRSHRARTLTSYRPQLHRPVRLSRAV